VRHVVSVSQSVLSTPLLVPREQAPQLFAAMLREFRLGPCAILLSLLKMFERADPAMENPQIISADIT